VAAVAAVFGRRGPMPMPPPIDPHPSPPAHHHHHHHQQQQQQQHQQQQLADGPKPLSSTSPTQLQSTGNTIPVCDGRPQTFGRHYFASAAVAV